MERSDEELRREIENWSQRFRASDDEDPAAWSQSVAAVMEMERENPQLADREYMLGLATAFLVETLAERQKLRHPPAWYKNLVGRLLMGFAHPTLLMTSLTIALFNMDDPTDLLQEAARLPELSRECRPRH